jgi:hypothetical protein
MFGGKELKRLELRRRELVLRSTLNRLAIMEELQDVQAALLPTERIVGSIRKARSWLLLLAPLVAIFATRGLRNNSSGFSKMIEVLKRIQPLLALWKQFRSPAREAERETSPAASVTGTRF